MSRYTEPLSKDVTQAWRRHIGSPQGQFGIDWLRQNRAPSATGASSAEMLEAALRWRGYMDALNDIEDILTETKQAPVSLEGPPLEAPDLRR